MARFDIHPLGTGYVLDVQADLPDDLNTRVVVPLIPLGEAPKPAERLNPVFDVDGVPHAMVSQFLAAVPVSELKEPVGSLARHSFAIRAAVDMVFDGI